MSERGPYRSEVRTFMALLDVAERFLVDGCILWPFSLTRRGYARARDGGRTRIASRMVMETSSPAPSAEHETAHACNVRACVNKRHLDWKTSSENNLDKNEHGTSLRGSRNPNARLTAGAVREIRASVLGPQALSIEWGVSVSTIRSVLKRRTWAHV